MDLDRSLGDVARARNHLIGVALQETIEDLHLTVRQSGDGPNRAHSSRVAIA